MDDYLLRGETALLVPMTEGLSFKASVVDLYNSSPAEDSKSNTLATLLGLSLGF
jgi:putative salt-induced outer membrane protein YdiY